MMRILPNVALGLLGALFLLIGYYDCVNGCWIFGGWRDLTMGMALFVLCVSPLGRSVTDAVGGRLAR